jgi:hypothetical protein
MFYYVSRNETNMDKAAGHVKASNKWRVLYKLQRVGAARNKATGDQ